MISFFIHFLITNIFFKAATVHRAKNLPHPFNPPKKLPLAHCSACILAAWRGFFYIFNDGDEGREGKNFNYEFKLNENVRMRKWRKCLTRWTAHQPPTFPPQLKVEKILQFVKREKKRNYLIFCLFLPRNCFTFFFEIFFVHSSHFIRSILRPIREEFSRPPSPLVRRIQSSSEAC